jgi:hypothetical protein
LAAPNPMPVRCGMQPNADHLYTLALGGAHTRTFRSIDDVCDALITEVPAGSRFIVYRSAPGKRSRVLIVDATKARETGATDPDGLAS